MRLRIKILSGFLILSLMLFIAGLWTIYELTTMGESANRLLKDNYQSIEASQAMIEALERQDSAVLLLLSGEWEQGRSILASADKAFRDNFDIARNNLTIPDEHTYVEKVADSYDEYKKLWERPIVDTRKQGNLTWYFKESHNAFRKVKNDVQNLLAINEEAMYTTSVELRNRAHRAVMPGIVAIVSALVFTLVFNYFVNHFFITPIVTITRKLKDFVDKGIPFDIDIETDDEIKELADSIKLTIAELRSYQHEQ